MITFLHRFELNRHRNFFTIATLNTPILLRVWKFSQTDALLAVLLFLLYPSTANADNAAGDIGSSLLIIFLAIIVGLIFFLPTIIAFRKKHPNRWVILALNWILGATGIVWIICLIWANKAIHLSEGSQNSEGTDGGESGLNIFANDEKKVRIVNPVNVPTHSTREIKSDIPTQLFKLKSLLDSDAITQHEFEDLKRKLLTEANG